MTATTELKTILCNIPEFKVTKRPVAENLTNIHLLIANAAIRYGFRVCPWDENSGEVSMRLLTDDFSLTVYGRADTTAPFQALWLPIPSKDNGFEETDWCASVEESLIELNKLLGQRAAKANSEI